MHVAALLSLGTGARRRARHAARTSETIGGNPGPEHNYVCPHADGKPPLDCYFDAVAAPLHDVPQREVDRDHRIRLREIARRHERREKRIVSRQAEAEYRAPLQGRAEGGGKSKQAVEGLHGLQDTWLAAMTELQWHSGESDDEYKTRVAKPYDDFAERIDGIRTEIVALETKAAPAKTAKKAVKAKPRRRRRSTERAVAGGRVRKYVGCGARRDLRRGRHARAHAARLPVPAAAARDGAGGRARDQRCACRLVAEAGTGTGKTFAYLVPALLYGGKVIVSTGTKTLQDQLFERDLPLIRDALAVPITVALLKGRANYVCHHHLERTAREGRLPSRDDARHLPKIVAFARASERGDRAELADVPENAGDLAARHVDARQLPRQQLRVPSRLLRDEGAQGRARRRRRRRQPSPVLRRRDAARRRPGRAAARRAIR